MPGHTHFLPEDAPAVLLGTGVLFGL